MKFKIEADSIGYFLYVKIDNQWEFVGFKLTIIGARFSAWRYKRRYRKSGEFEL